MTDLPHCSNSTREAYIAAKAFIQQTQTWLDMLDSRRERGYPHDAKLREVLEPQIAWWRQVQANIERDGDDFEVPEYA